MLYCHEMFKLVAAQATDAPPSSELTVNRAGVVRLASMLGCRVFEHEAMFLEPGMAGPPSPAGVLVGFETFYRWFEETKQQVRGPAGLHLACETLH